MRQPVFSRTAPRSPRLSLGAAAVAAALLASPAAQAAGPWALGITQALSHESNVSRAADAFAEADTISTTGARVAFDQPFGRQRFTAQAALELQRFVSHSEWNSQPYRLGAELDWTAADLWEGELGLDAAEQLYRQDQNLANPQRNLEQTRRAWLRARKGVVTDWTFEAALNAYERDLSLASFDASDQTQLAVEGGWRFQPNPALALSAKLRHTRGEYPRRTAAGADDYTRDDIELASTWQPTGASSFDARLAFGRESHSLQAVADSNVWNGAFSWRWKPTGKLNFTTTLARSSDTDSSRFESNTGTDGDSSVTATNNNYLSTSLALNGRWAATAKISVDAGLRMTHRELDSRRTGTAGVQGSDRLSAFNLGLRYAFSRSLDLGCSFSTERRSVTEDALALSFPYSARSLGCFAQFWLGRN